MRRKRLRIKVDPTYARLRLLCPWDLYAELKEIARSNRCSLEFVIRNALEHYVDEVVSFSASQSDRDVPASATGGSSREADSADAICRFAALDHAIPIPCPTETE